MSDIDELEYYQLQARCNKAEQRLTGVISMGHVIVEEIEELFNQIINNNPMAGETMKEMQSTISGLQIAMLQMVLDPTWPVDEEILEKARSSGEENSVPKKYKDHISNLMREGPQKLIKDWNNFTEKYPHRMNFGQHCAKNTAEFIRKALESKNKNIKVVSIEDGGDLAKTLLKILKNIESNPSSFDMNDKTE